MTAAQKIQQYVDGVLDGSIVAGQLQIAAVRRYVGDLKRASKPGCSFVFNQTAAEVALEFFPLLCHSSAEFAGQSFQLEPDQMFIIWNLIGWKRKTDGQRRFKYAHIEAARKWGKTCFAAAICLLLFFLDGEARPEIYCAATKRAQSKLVWEEVQRFLEARAFLKSRVTVRESIYTIQKEDRGIITALGADGGGSDGYFPHLVVFDELHEWKTKAHRKLWAKLRTGSSARRQPLFIVITTAGDDQSKLWASEREYAVKVLNGKAQDDTLFAFILCLDDDDELLDPSTWPKANPHLGPTAKWQDYTDLAAKAELDPATRRDFERYYANRKVASITRAIPDKAWALGAKPLIVLSGRLCHGAVDLGFRDDLAGVGWVFPPLAADGVWYIKAKAFIAEKCRRDLRDEPFADLIRKGLLIVTPGNTTDMATLHAHVDECRSIYNVKSMAIDPNNAMQFGSELMAKKIDVAEFKQTTANYNEPFREFLRLLSEGKIIHGGCPLLTWCQQNMQAFTSAQGLMMPSKPSSTEKIDPLVSVVMGFAEAIHFRRKLMTKGTGPQVRFL